MNEGQIRHTRFQDPDLRLYRGQCPRGRPVALAKVIQDHSKRANGDEKAGGIHDQDNASTLGPSAPAVPAYDWSLGN